MYYCSKACLAQELPARATFSVNIFLRPGFYTDQWAKLSRQTRFTGNDSARYPLAISTESGARLPKRATMLADVSDSCHFSSVHTDPRNLTMRRARRHIRWSNDPWGGGAVACSTRATKDGEGIDTRDHSERRTSLLNAAWCISTTRINRPNTQVRVLLSNAVVPFLVVRSIPSPFWNHNRRNMPPTNPTLNAKQVLTLLAGTYNLLNTSRYFSKVLLRCLFCC